MVLVFAADLDNSSSHPLHHGSAEVVPDFEHKCGHFFADGKSPTRFALKLKDKLFPIPLSASCVFQSKNVLCEL